MKMTNAKPVPASDFATHEVYNQAGDLVDFDPYGDDLALKAAVEAFSAGWASDRLYKAAAIVGSHEVQALARQANKFTPELVTHDRFGHRVDQVELHPSWHQLIAHGFRTETHSLAWTAKRPGGHVARAALSYLWNQGENGICCPMGMTFASIAALRHAPELAAYWEPRILRNDYDHRPVVAEEKHGITVGMAMTEKQGGSDLRQTQTTARPAGKARGSGVVVRPADGQLLREVGRSFGAARGEGCDAAGEGGGQGRSSNARAASAGAASMR
jgi:putative acyl-CoA dehydrogenase